MYIYNTRMVGIVLKYIQTCIICYTVCHVLYYKSDYNYYCIQINKIANKPYIYILIFFVQIQICFSHEISLTQNYF